MALEHATLIVSGNGNPKRDWGQFSSPYSPHGIRFEYYTAYIGTQFNTTQLPDAPIPPVRQSKPPKVTKTTPLQNLLGQESFINQQQLMSTPQQSYQIARFLNESGDYKSLVVPMEDPNSLVRKDMHLVALKRQIADIDALICVN